MRTISSLVGWKAKAEQDLTSRLQKFEILTFYGHRRAYLGFYFLKSEVRGLYNALFRPFLFKLFTINTKKYHVVIFFVLSKMLGFAFIWYM